MPNFKMQFQNKNNLNQTYTPIKNNLQHNLVMRPKTTQVRNTTSSLTNMINTIKNSPKGGCRSCGR